MLDLDVCLFDNFETAGETMDLSTVWMRMR